MDNKIKSYASYQIKTESEWLANTAPLAKGELAFIETDSGSVKIKVGNGISTFEELKYTDVSTIEDLTENNKLLPTHISTPEDEGKYVTILYKDGKWVAGYVPVSFIYVGAELPTSDIGVDGDIYLQTE